MSDNDPTLARLEDQINWYEAGHELVQAVVLVTHDVRAFFLKNLGERTPTVAATGRN